MLALLYQLNIEKIEVVFTTNQSGYLQIRHVTIFVLIHDWVFSYSHLSCFCIHLEYVFIKGLKKTLMNICFIIICVLNLSKCIVKTVNLCSISIFSCLSGLSVFVESLESYSSENHNVSFNVDSGCYSTLHILNL
jgi:hypothetical protein